MTHLLSLLAMWLAVVQPPAPQTIPPAAPQVETHQIGAGVTSPVVLQKVDPYYTSAAMKAWIQGEVVLDGVVTAEGMLTELRIVRSLDPVNGLDQAALDAAAKWRFKPGMKDGQPVRVRVQLVLEFRLRDFAEGAHLSSEPGVVPPALVTLVDPMYTAEAMRMKLQGSVDVEVVVGPDGSVARARVARSLDALYGLDQNAVQAALKSTFTPGTFQGQPAQVLVTLTLQFRLHAP